MKVGKHFSLDEFIVSQEGARKGLDNTPPPDVIENIKTLCEKVLDPLREAIGVPIVISSGYRSPEINKAVGGARNSQHLFGQAADILVPGWTVEHVVTKIKLMNLPFDQLIDEYGVWTHVSFNQPLKNRGEVLNARIVSGKKTYTKVG